MNRRLLTTALLGFITIIITNWSCTKLDTTNLGSDLLPAVDNVNTFESIIDIQAFQGKFNDTVSLSRAEDHILGQITSDPLFGKTKASVYLQLKPPTFPFSISQPGDTLVGIDSVILCLSYRGAWGDTSVVQHITVREIPINTGGLWDSLFQPKPLTYQPIPDNNGNLVNYNASYKDVDIRTLNNKVVFARGKDSVTGQIRIRLSDVYADKLFKQDSILVPRPGFTGNAFFRDSTFRKIFKGLAVESIMGEALMTLNLADAKTRLEIHYRQRSNTVLDTTYTVLRLQSSILTSILPSAVANKVVRDYNGSPLLNNLTPGVKNEIFLQTTPGTFAELSMPGLNIFRDTNRIIHRAQVRITQIPDLNNNLDKVFIAPNYLYLDLKDSSIPIKYKPIYFDLNPLANYFPDNVPRDAFFPGAVEFGYFGGFLKKKLDPSSGLEISYYDFNITRYMQQLVTRHGTNYDFRVFAPYSFSYPQYSPRNIGYPNNLGYGRVRVGGTNGNYKMQLSIIWSQVKVP